jgi:hypothetical protein
MRKKIKWTPRQLLTGFILLNLIAALFIAADFGISTDESPEGQRAALALAMFTGDIESNPETAYANLNQVQYYGTAATVIGQVAMDGLSSIIDVHPTAIRHYVYFVFFQIGITALFFLTANFVNEWAALLVAIIFGTQPLFFGHAFINPKDIPLLSVFLVAVAIGFHMVDALSQKQPVQEPPSSTNRRKKQRWLIVLLVFAASLQFLKVYLYPLMKWFIGYAYNAPETHLAHRIFQLFIAGGSLEGYLILAEPTSYNLYRWVVLFFFLSLVYFGVQVKRHKLFPHWVTLPVLLAGLAWGFALSTRTVAIAAGGIVGLYALIKLGKKGIPYLVSYTLTAGAASYITWPYLWLFGPKGFLDSLLKFSDFINWEGNILFEGRLYPIHAVPDRYLPKLMLLQFTEPVVILSLVGFLLSLYLVYKKKLDGVKMSLVYAWFALPLLYTILADTVTYNNFRQYLFITPPLFIFAGLALQEGAALLKRKIWLGLAVVLILLPGVFSLIELHPYQYVYYNQFTGGVEGAENKYELDYWLTSYKELAEYLDAHTPPGSRILVWTNDHRIQIYTEQEFKLYNQTEIPEKDYNTFEYAIMPAVRLYAEHYLTDQQNIYEVVRDNAVIGMVKKID